ncbi:hypothetical protein D9757_008796 [Collybiopsis confluens]|uniref:DASH complex subunit ASK1 n=1 Tax=Collybiopsis confluens TaxID=2823264 RepID=A0A8H5H5L0_9AGAR|nr:hypothetical protein D9757_008796 [Collybiopsis confluens]
MPDDRKPIPPNPPRWKPNPDPMSIEIPGLDTSASAQDQIEQIEQLITLKLQNIDENFAKVHNTLSTRILPAVKRYAVGTEPVREAAKFWVSFYEQAAQIRIPTFEDYDAATESSAVQTTEHASSLSDQEEDNNEEEQGTHYSIASAESSFAPGPFSSTPAAARLAHATAVDDTDASWSASIESPFIRLDREIRNFSQDADETDSSIAPGSPTPSKPASRTSIPSVRTRESFHPSQHTSTVGKGKGKAREQPEKSLLKDLLRQNIYTSGGITSPSPKKGKAKAYANSPIKDLNPFLPPGTNPSKWDGLVDLRDVSSSTSASVTTPVSKRFPTLSSYRRSASPTKYSSVVNDDDDDDDDSFDGLPPGMSPPVLISPARPIKSSIRLGQTPGKAAASRITKDIVANVQARHTYGQHQPAANVKPIRGLFNRGVLESDSSLSTMSSPPSMSKYNLSGMSSSGMVTDSSLESMMRQVGLRGSIEGISEPSPASTSRDVHGYGDILQLEPEIQSQLKQQESGGGYLTPMAPQYQPNPFYDDDDDDDDDDSDMINNTAHPSAAFLMLSQNRGPIGDVDDSFDDDDEDEEEVMAMRMALGMGMLGEVGTGDPDIMIPIHPFARMGVIEDDSFDDDDSFGDDMVMAQHHNQGIGMFSGQLEEETLFGVPPAERERRMSMAAAAASTGASMDGAGIGSSAQRVLVMHGGDLMDSDQLTEDLEKAAESPTPVPGGQSWNQR